MTGRLLRPAGHRIVRWLAGLLCAGSAVAGCTVATPGAPATPPMPRDLSSSPPASDPAAPYVIDGLAEAALPTAPGQPMVVGVPVAVHAGSVILESVTLLPLAGYPTPELAGAGLVAGTGYTIAAWDWPPRTTPTRGPGGGPAALPVAPVAGYSLSARHPAALYYAIRGFRDGRIYYAAGVRLVYRTATGDRTVDLYQVGADCVVAGFPHVNRQCTADPAAAGRITAR